MPNRALHHVRKDAEGRCFQDSPREASIETLGISVLLRPSELIAHCVWPDGEHDDDARNGRMGPYRVAAVCGGVEPRRVSISKIFESSL